MSDSGESIFEKKHFFPLVSVPLDKGSTSSGDKFVPNTIETFGSMSGLRLNSKKTEALWIGSMVGNKEKLFPEKNFKWREKKVKALGVWLSTDPSITLNINYREKTDKIRNILSNWKYRRLTLLGVTQHLNLRTF